MYLNREEVARLFGVSPNTISQRQTSEGFPKPDKIEKVDGWRKVYYWKESTACRELKKRERQSANAKNLKSQKQKIEELFDEGKTKEEIATVFDVRPNSISSVLGHMVRAKSKRTIACDEFDVPKGWEAANRAFNTLLRV